MILVHPHHALTATIVISQREFGEPSSNHMVVSLTQVFPSIVAELNYTALRQVADYGLAFKP